MLPLSLEKLDRFLIAGLRQEFIDPIRDHGTGFLKLSSVIIGRSVKLDAMTAIITVRYVGDLIERIIGIHLSCPLPRILNAVGKEDVSLTDIPATLVNRSLESLRHCGHAITKGSFAHGSPVGFDEHCGTHDMLFTRDLEPSVLRAVLEGPGAG